MKTKWLPLFAFSWLLAPPLPANDYGTYMAAIRQNPPAWQQQGGSLLNHRTSSTPTLQRAQGASQDSIRPVPRPSPFEMTHRGIPINPDPTIGGKIFRAINPLTPFMDGLDRYESTGNGREVGKGLLDVLIKQGYGRIPAMLYGAYSGTPVGFLQSLAIRATFGLIYDKLGKEKLHRQLDSVPRTPDPYDQRQSGETGRPFIGPINRSPTGPYLEAVNAVEGQACAPKPPSDEPPTFNRTKLPGNALLKDYLDKRVEKQIGDEIRRKVEARHKHEKARKQEPVIPQEAEENIKDDQDDRDTAETVGNLLGIGLSILDGVNRHDSDSGQSHSGGGSRSKSKTETCPGN